MMRLARAIAVVASLIVLIVIIALAGYVIVGSGSNVHQLYRQGDEWVTVEHLGDPAYSLYAAPDGTVWALNASGLSYIKKNAGWSHIYTPDGHPTDFTLDGTTIWLVTHNVIARCDTASLTCSAVQPINCGSSIAAWHGMVAAVTQCGQLHWFDKTTWHQAALSDLLPGFDSTKDDTLPKLMYTDDGSLWLKWNQLWRFKGAWKAATFGAKPTTGIRLTGATPGLLWTEWSNGLVAADPTLQRWQLYTWKDMNGPGYDWIFDITAAPDQTVWVAARNGLLHFDGTAWTLLTLPNNPLVSAVAVTPDNTLWVQVTNTSETALSIGAFGGLFALGLAAAAVLWFAVTGRFPARTQRFWHGM